MRCKYLLCFSNTNATPSVSAPPLFKRITDPVTRLTPAQRIVGVGAKILVLSYCLATHL